MNPNARLSTAAVYGELQPAEYDSGEATRTWLGPGTAAMPPPINSLAAPACRLEPGIQDCLSQLRRAGVETAMVSGSGPTCFGLAASQAEAERSAAEVSGAVARFVTRDEALMLDL